MTDEQDLRERAAALEALANAEAAAVPRMMQRATLERAASRLCGRTWDWLVVETIGGPPTLLITQYRGEP